MMTIVKPKNSSGGEESDILYIYRVYRTTHNSIIIARHFSFQPYINGVLSLVRASVINGEHGDEPFTRMNNSPIDSVPVQHLVPRHCSPVPSIPTLRKIR